jgi:CRISPR-associated protein Cmr1
MAREVKIKKSDGKFYVVKLSDNYQEEFNKNLHRSKKNGEIIVRETREYELITPLFGGGAVTKKADEVSIIRATEIRGHLRFWWRATRGGQFSTIEELKKHEDAIFGSTEKHSALQIEVEIINRGQNFPKQKDYNGEFQPIDSIKSPLSYVAFPLRGERNAQIIENIEFKVKVSYPQKYIDDVTASIWAWEIFGGLGARTRRGFGAVQNKNYLPTDKTAVENDIKNGLSANLTGSNWANDVPHLASYSASIYKVTNSQNTAYDVWKSVINKYKAFRQFRTPKSFSRSNWSEPDAIRRIFLPRSYKKHAIPKTTVDKFPRANFGLPIIFEFKDENLGEPLKTSLEGRDENQKRLASPLIFRVIKCSNGQFAGVAIILSGIRMPTSGVILKDAPGNPIVQTDLTSTEASSAGLNSILSGNPNVIEKFLSTL